MRLVCKLLIKCLLPCLFVNQILCGVGLQANCLLPCLFDESLTNDLVMYDRELLGNFYDDWEFHFPAAVRLRNQHPNEIEIRFSKPSQEGTEKEA